mgnify:CR=1 FL=1
MNIIESMLLRFDGIFAIKKRGTMAGFNYPTIMLYILYIAISWFHQDYQHIRLWCVLLLLSVYNIYKLHAGPFPLPRSSAISLSIYSSILCSEYLLLPNAAKKSKDITITKTNHAIISKVSIYHSTPKSFTISSSREKPLTILLLTPCFHRS